MSPPRQRLPGRFGEARRELQLQVLNHLHADGNLPGKTPRKFLDDLELHPLGVEVAVRLADKVLVCARPGQAGLTRQLPPEVPAILSLHWLCRDRRRI